MKYFIFSWSLFISLYNYAQDHPFTLLDTVKFDQVIISNELPIDDEQRAMIYRNNNFSDIDDINDRLGGVSLIRRGAYAMEPLINSFSGGQINVTIDGMKMFGACTDKMDPVTSYVETVNLEKIQLNQGVAGSEHGTTIGGSINMSLQNPEFNSTAGEAGLLYETISNGRMGYAKMNLGNNKIAYRISGVYKNYDAYLDGNGDIVSFSYYKKYNIHQSLRYNLINAGELQVDYLIDDAFDIGYPALPMDVLKAKGRMYSLQYNVRGGGGGLNDFTAKTYVNTVYHVMDDSKRDSLYFVKNRRTSHSDSVYMRMDMPGWSNTYGGYIQGQFFIGDDHLLFLKAEDYYNWSKAEMTMFMNNLSNPGEPPMYAETWPEHSRNVAGVFLQHQYYINSTTKFQTDLRVDYSNSQLLSKQGIRQFSILGYDALENKIRWSKTLNVLMEHSTTNFKFTGSIGYGERIPTLSENYGFYLFNAFDGFDYIGNPQLKKETSYNLMTKVFYTRPDFKLSIENYFNYLNNYILGQIQPDLSALNLYASGVKKYENLSHAQLATIIFQLYYAPANHLKLMNVLKYNYGQISSGQPIPLISPLNNILSVRYNDKSYFSEIELEASARQTRINSEFGEQTTSGYVIVNIFGGLNFEFFKLDHHFKAGINNVFNEVYSRHLDWGNFHRPGRNFHISVKTSF